MAKTFKFEIVTPEKVVYSNPVQGITAVGTEGALGILADHAPLITELQTSILVVTDANNNSIRFALDGGFLEVMANNVIVLTDSCVMEDEVDIEKMRAEKESAEKALAMGGTTEVKEKAQAALKRANVWLSLANK
ncbi:MAG: ATP synthase F1 subunit epsilon [Candidatus Jettenia sp.]|uniref:ATP synthase epsilon chain n=1 Tax=Candidatus Jettenia caeni TaxID=247490 RepID=I3ILC3_9BACT|nr:ATP synthase F1 subunit epsilon [Candidatus Jettenia sp. AMX1]MBC6927662.1 ATP synthase F1 subunit epsilon [Candidatus Jettenia sp.]GAB62518.1 F0F1 ATP synthase epsilon subunit [Candidatus Jettenia caeni]KAA0250067.1 MAG: ATP synthase F1 subunit epsilon [Candidatus Jettenia sp. AMX1]MCE7880149.1 ATP synthase F1 subunit epsilon [Candidatus Jettenia sp. AMX1]MCQ3926589.1 ATP synthase F1 subunit epsilon [Candidatus Jettenia sp.]